VPALETKADFDTTGLGHCHHQFFRCLVRVEDAPPDDAEPQIGDGAAECQSVGRRQVESVVNEVELFESRLYHAGNVLDDELRRPGPDLRALDVGCGAVGATQSTAAPRLHGNP